VNKLCKVKFSRNRRKLKGQFTKTKNSLIISPKVVSIMYDFFSSVEHNIF